MCFWVVGGRGHRADSLDRAGYRFGRLDKLAPNHDGHHPHSFYQRCRSRRSDHPNITASSRAACRSIAVIGK
jgi:hypothetical protein